MNKSNVASDKQNRVLRGDPLNIVQLLPDLDSGGVERGTLEISKAALERGWNSWVISNKGRLVNDLTSHKGNHIDWDIGGKHPWTLRWIPKLIKFCRLNKIDILHARSRMPAWVAYFAWRLMPVRSKPIFVTTVHGLNSVNPYSRIMTRGEHVIVVSGTTKEYILNNYPEVNESKLKLIYRGVDSGDFPFDYRPDSAWLKRWVQEFPQVVNAKLVILPGRITRRKGHVEFVELISCLRKKMPDVIGMIVGDWTAKQHEYVIEIKDRIAQKGLNNAVILTGHRSDMKEIYATSDLVLSLSRKPESFGRTMVEALSMGVRCAGLNHGGVGEILEKMFPQGRLSMTGNTKSWAESIRSLLSSQAPKPLPNAFPLEAVLNQELDCYQQWVSERLKV